MKKSKKTNKNATQAKGKKQREQRRNFIKTQLLFTSLTFPKRPITSINVTVHDTLHFRTDIYLSFMKLRIQKEKGEKKDEWSLD